MDPNNLPHWDISINQENGTADHYITTAITCSASFGHGEYQITTGHPKQFKPPW